MGKSDKECKESVTDSTTGKLSYEELENVARQLSEQSRQLYTKLQESNMFNTFKRLDYLFKVVENTGAFSSSFVEQCTEEIQSLLTVEKEEKDDADSNI